MKWELNVGAAVGQSVHETETGQALLKACRVLGEVLEVGFILLDVRARLVLANDDAISFVESTQERLVFHTG